MTATTDEDSAPEGDAAPPRRGVRIGLLVILVAAIGGIAGWRVVERLHQPSAGDRYDVTFTVNRECQSLDTATFDGLVAAGDHPALRRWTGGEGRGTLTIDAVHGLPDSDGVGFTGTLVTDDGLTVDVDGGTEGEYFFSLACAIGG